MDIEAFLRKNRKFMTVREIASGTNQTVQAVNRKVNRLHPNKVHKVIKVVNVGRRSSKQPVSFYKAR